MSGGRDLTVMIQADIIPICSFQRTNILPQINIKVSEGLKRIKIVQSRASEIDYTFLRKYATNSLRALCPASMFPLPPNFFSREIADHDLKDQSSSVTVGSRCVNSDTKSERDIGVYWYLFSKS